MIQNRTYMNPRSSREQNLSRQIADFLSGRYGFDILSLFLIELVVILVLINRLALKFAPLDHLLALIVLVVLFRAFSYNTRARKAEGDKFLSLLGPHSLWLRHCRNRIRIARPVIVRCFPAGELSYGRMLPVVRGNPDCPYAGADTS